MSRKREQNHLLISAKETFEYFKVDFFLILLNIGYIYFWDMGREI
jgi:hypothetical protein